MHPVYKLTYEAVNISIVQVVLMNSSQNAPLTSIYNIFIEVLVYYQAKKKKMKERTRGMINVSTTAVKVRG